MTDCFGVSRTLRGLPSSQMQILDRLGYVCAVAIVSRQFIQVLVQLFGEKGFNRFACELMQQPASLDQYRVIGNLLRESMFEDIFDISQRRLLVDELAQLKIEEPAVQFII